MAAAAAFGGAVGALFAVQHKYLLVQVAEKVLNTITATIVEEMPSDVGEELGQLLGQPLASINRHKRGRIEGAETQGGEFDDDNSDTKTSNLPFASGSNQADVDIFHTEIRTVGTDVPKPAGEISAERVTPCEKEVRPLDGLEIGDTCYVLGRVLENKWYKGKLLDIRPRPPELRVRYLSTLDNSTSLFSLPSPNVNYAHVGDVRRQLPTNDHTIDTPKTIVGTEPMQALVLDVDDLVQVQYSGDMKWYTAKVMDTSISSLEHCVLIHYKKWNKRWDEWVQVSSSRLRLA
jgi:hypothetical protein